jgi:hypothetical protein
MSAYIVHIDGKILASFDLIKNAYNVSTIPLERWVTKDGLVIPYSPASYNAVRYMNGLEIGLPGVPMIIFFFLLRLDGSLCQIELNVKGSQLDMEKDQVFIEHPTGPGVRWVKAFNKDLEEKAASSLYLPDMTADKYKEQAVKTDLYMAKHYQLYDLKKLHLEFLRIHKALYPKDPFHQRSE